MNDYKDWVNQNPLTIVESGSLHFCLEYREVKIAGQIVELTAKEFDILALLILNPRRVFTYLPSRRKPCWVVCGVLASPGSFAFDPPSPDKNRIFLTV